MDFGTPHESETVSGVDDPVGLNSQKVNPEPNADDVDKIFDNNSVSVQDIKSEHGDCKSLDAQNQMESSDEETQNAIKSKHAHKSETEEIVDVDMEQFCQENFLE